MSDAPTARAAASRGLRWRSATAADVDALTALERATNLVALGPIFPPERYPFPTEGVRSRWRETLADPCVTVEVVDGADGLVAFVAADAERLRHLGVHPDCWGRGIARAAIGRVLDAMRTRGVERALLWCLADNTRARRLYERLGWAPTGVRKQTPWPPYPTELEFALPLTGEPYARSS